MKPSRSRTILNQLKESGIMSDVIKEVESSLKVEGIKETTGDYRFEVGQLVFWIRARQGKAFFIDGSVPKKYEGIFELIADKYDLESYVRYR